MGEMPTPASHFPNAVVWPLPCILHECQQILSQIPCFLPRTHAHPACGVQGRYTLPINVELKLVGGSIAHTYRLRSFVTRQPVKLELGQAPGAEDVIHNLQISGITSNGSHDPVTESPSFVNVAPSHERI